MNIVAFQFCNSRVKGSRGGERAQSLEGEGMMERSVLVMKLMSHAVKLSEQQCVCL